MIGIVVVSHSRPLAEAAVQLATAMVPADARPAVAVAAGLDAETLGTDATAIAAAIERVDSRDGVLVFTDVGSSVLSARMALDFVDADLAARTQLSAAPLVEGLVVGLVTASTGASLPRVEAEATAALACKSDSASTTDTESAAKSESSTFTVHHPLGLHARPIAALVQQLRGLDATVELVNVTTGAGPAPANSVTRIATLGVREGHQLLVRADGPDASEAIERVAALVHARPN